MQALNGIARAEAQPALSRLTAHGSHSSKAHTLPTSSPSWTGIVTTASDSNPNPIAGQLLKYAPILQQRQQTETEWLVSWLGSCIVQAIEFRSVVIVYLGYLRLIISLGFRTWQLFREFNDEWLTNRRSL